MKNMFKIFALVFTLLFLWAAYVQYNDPDATMWYAIYGVAALTSLLFFLGRLNYFVTSILCVLYLTGTFMVWPEKFEGVTIGEGHIENIEKGREALGLLISAVVMLVYALRIKFVNNSKV